MRDGFRVEIYSSNLDLDPLDRESVIMLVGVVRLEVYSDTLFLWCLGIAWDAMYGRHLISSPRKCMIHF